MNIAELRAREQDFGMKKMEWEKKTQFVDEQKTREEEIGRREQEDLQLRINRQDEDMMRRQQENNLFVQVGWVSHDELLVCSIVYFYVMIALVRVYELI